MAGCISVNVLLKKKKKKAVLKGEILSILLKTGQISLTWLKLPVNMCVRFKGCDNHQSDVCSVLSLRLAISWLLAYCCKQQLCYLQEAQTHNNYCLSVIFTYGSGLRENWDLFGDSWQKLIWCVCVNVQLYLSTWQGLGRKK